jgi:DNA adenine methylase
MWGIRGVGERDVEVLFACGTARTDVFSKTSLKMDTTGLNFFYFDPPYRPMSTTSSFNTYVKEAFDDDEQRRLANYCRRIAAKRNCLWMLSNSDCSAKNLEDAFFESIYTLIP